MRHRAIATVSGLLLVGLVVVGAVASQAGVQTQTGTSTPTNTPAVDLPTAAATDTPEPVESATATSTPAPSDTPVAPTSKRRQCQPRKVYPGPSTTEVTSNARNTRRRRTAGLAVTTAGNSARMTGTVRATRISLRRPHHKRRLVSSLGRLRPQSP